MAQTSKKLSLKPLGDRIVVKPAEKEGEKKLASGIILPEAANKEKLLKGEVITVGPGRRNDEGVRIPIEVKPGDTVFFKKPWDEPIKVNGVEYYVISESEIILIED
jgi:chaperonin GroES